jgi:D-amino-acid dehydrogenase
MTAKRVAVIGAGIVGVSSALWLQRAGHDVVLIDRLGIGEATSYGNAGVVACGSVVPVTEPGLLRKLPGYMLSSDGPLFLRWSYLPRLLPFLIPMLCQATPARAARAAQGLAPLATDAAEQHEVLAAGTGAERWLKRSDYVFAYADREAFEADAFSWDLRREHGFQWEEIEGPAVREWEPALSQDINFLARVDNHAMVTDPGRYVGALGEHFLAQGGQVRRLDVQGLRCEGGRVVAVETDEEEIACDAAVIAAGAWSSRLTERLGLRVPLESERGYHIEFSKANVTLKSPIAIVSGKFVVTSMEGRLRCAGLVEFAGLDAPQSEKPTAFLEREALRAFPGLRYGTIYHWMGHRPLSVDSLPFIGEAPGLDGVYCAFGHHHLGLTLGPKTGRLIADLVSERRPNIDLSPYRVGRFSRREWLRDRPADDG